MRDGTEAWEPEGSGTQSRGPEVRGKLVPGNDSHAHSLQALGLLVSRGVRREGRELKEGQ